MVVKSEKIAGVNVRPNDLADICRRHDVKELSIFGSVARGDSGPDSDVDILVEFLPEARVGLLKFGALERELAALFGRSVDLVSKPGLKPHVRPSVLADSRLLYAA